MFATYVAVSNCKVSCYWFELLRDYRCSKFLGSASTQEGKTKYLEFCSQEKASDGHGELNCSLFCFVFFKVSAKAKIATKQNTKLFFLSIIVNGLKRELLLN